MLSRHYVVIFSFLILSSCGKNIECEDAELCMVNDESDWVLYCWNCSMGIMDTLMPGEKVCANVGYVKVKGDVTESKVMLFHTTNAFIYIDVDNCYEEHYLSDY